MGAFFCKHSIKSATSQFFLKRQGTLARPLGNIPRRLFWRVLWRSVFQTHLLCLAYPRAAPPVTVAALRSAFQAPQWNTAVRRVNWAGLGNGSAASRLARKNRIFQLHGSYMAVTCGAGHFVEANEKVNGAKGRYRLFYLSDLWRNVKAAASFFFL